MTAERTKVDFPLWRKKVDSSLFLHNGTAIPKWVCKVWNLEEVFPGLKGKKDPQSAVSIKFNKKLYTGQVTCTWPTGRANKTYRMWFSDDLTGCGRTRLVGILMGDFQHDRAGRADLSEGNEAADLGAAVRTCGREALPALAPA